MDLITPKRHWQRKHATRKRAIDTALLADDSEIQAAFASSVSKQLPAESPTGSSWTEFGAILQETAIEKVGYRQSFTGGRRSALSDPEVRQLVEEVRKLGIVEHAACTKHQKAAARANTRSKRRELTAVLKRKGRERLEARVLEVEQAKDDGRKMFAALRALGIRSTSGVSINDSEGRTVHNIETQASLLTAHFKDLFAPNLTTNPHPPLCTELCYPITQMEVQEAASKLKNNRACGPDFVPNELLKYACAHNETAQWIAQLLNAAVEGKIHLNEIGDGILIPLQKPGKPRGPLSNLRPVVLLNGIRKLLSLILLKRFSPYANLYIPASQAGFRKGRSCADIIFAKRLICSMALLTDMEFHFLCLDLSRAFDTPSREMILESLLAASDADKDVYQLAHTLLTGTSLSVRVGEVSGQSFQSTVGVPQGDSFSPVAFTTTFERAMQEVRPMFPATPTMDLQLSLTTEMQYADDIDFVSTSQDYLDRVMDVIDTELPPRHLHCNRNKTQRVHVSKEGTEWQNIRTLGALLGEENDVKRRMQLAELAFRRMFGLFAGVGASLVLKVRVWNTLVRPVLLYGCGTWGLTAVLTEKLCALHRRHLRVMAGYRWPKHISNKAIYHLTQTQPLSHDLQRARLRLLGHCLRLPRDTPAQKALDLTVNDIPKARRGRPRSCLLSTLRADLKKVGMNLRTPSGLEQLRIHAADRDKWEETIEHIYSA